MYECFNKTINIAYGGDYCYLTYYWPEDYEEKTKCLVNQGVKNDSNYCVLKDRYLKELSQYDDTVKYDPGFIYDCFESFGIPKGKKYCDAIYYACPNYTQIITKKTKSIGTDKELDKFNYLISFEGANLTSLLNEIKNLTN